MPQPRFSKRTVKEWVIARMQALEKEHGFKCNNGWAQVDGKGEVINRAYGEYQMLNTFFDAFDLDAVTYVPVGNRAFNG